MAAALRAHAKGLYCAEAAVELLIGHAWWLHRDDFVGGFVEVGRGLVGGTVMAWIDWQAAVTTLDAERLPCCDSEGQILRIAAGIAQGVPIDLRAALTGLDAVNLALVAGAVLHTGGHRGAIAGFARVEGR